MCTFFDKNINPIFQKFIFKITFFKINKNLHLNLRNLPTHETKTHQHTPKMATDISDIDYSNLDIQCEYTAAQYEEAKAWLEKWDNGNKKPTEEQIMQQRFVEKTDEEIFEEFKGLIGPAPDLTKIKNKAKESMVLVDNIPEAGLDKFEKLKAKVLQKINDKKVEKNAKFEIVEHYFPVYENKQKNEPFALFQLGDEAQAREFEKLINDFKFTKSSIWKTYNLAVIDNYLNSPDEWIAPVIPERPDTRQLEEWQNDNDDHFFVLHDTITTVYRNKCGYGVNKVMAPSGPEIVAEPRVKLHAGDWNNIQWSPKGNYLIVIDSNNRGIGVFVVNNGRLEPKMKIPEKGAFNASVSPDERHIMVQSGITDDEGRFTQSDVIPPKISIWSLANGVEKFGYSKKSPPFRFPAKAHCAEVWEKFQWSYDGRFLGTRKTDHLCIFDAWNDFKPVIDPNTRTGQFINVPGMDSFQFSPGANYVCYWVPEEGERPLKVVVREIPSLRIVRTKNLYKVKYLEMKWHPDGSYLALRCSKPMKGTRRYLASSFELFHINEKEVPIDVVDCEQYVKKLDDKTFEAVMDQPPAGYEWEPNGNRFAVWYGPNDYLPKTVIRIFKPQVGAKIKELPSLERHSNPNTLRWCSTGRYMMLAQFRVHNQSGGMLEWIDVDGETSQDSNNKYIKNKNKDLRKPVSLRTQTHQFMTNLDWDTTGRYVVTSSSMYEHKMENGFIIWNFQGKELYAKKLDKFCQFKWRPRPKSILSEAHLKEIHSNIKEYAKQFQEYDAIKSTQVSAEETKKLLRVLNNWNARRNHYADHRRAMRERFAELDGEDSQDDEQEVEIQVRIKESKKVVSRVEDI